MALLAIGISVMVVMIASFNNGRGQETDQESRTPWNESVEESQAVAPVRPQGTRAGNPAAASDWEMQQVDSVPSTNPSAPKTTTSDSNTKSAEGWAMDEVETSSTGKSTGSKTAQPESPKKTRQGDWALEEVEGKK